ncbi:MAG: TraR/DksA family transcriptional regulator [Acidimicrobiia bacterium]
MTALWSVRETAQDSATTLGRLRRQLLAERRVQLERADALAGDVGTDAPGTVECELAPMLVASARQAVYEIDEALARMDAGTYGWCLVCGSRLAVARLRAIPQARLCVACRSRSSAAAS